MNLPQIRLGNPMYAVSVTHGESDSERDSSDAPKRREKSHPADQ
jgi:hypothetical protein